MPPYPRTSKRKRDGAIALTALLAALALLGTLVTRPATGPGEVVVVGGAGPLSIRRLSDRSDAMDLTIYLAYPGSDAESRFFETDVFRRYVTGRINYNVVRHGEMKPTDDEGPCLAVVGSHTVDYEELKLNYPNCKTMVNNDERCYASDKYDFRQYYSSRKTTSQYLPLGVRFDSLSTLTRIKQSPGFEMKPPSQRKLAFNAMFSMSTNPLDRGPLAEVLERDDKLFPSLRTHVALKEKWRSYSPNNQQYVQTLLDSVFTLTPTGRNPECFRMYEAIEAGSIPVMLKDPKTKMGCRGGLRYWSVAPILHLDAWDDLYPAVKKLMEDPESLDEMMTNLRAWYDEKFMGKLVRDFEDSMIRSHAGDIARDGGDVESHI